MSTTTRRSIDMAQSAVQEFPDRLIPYVYALPSYERAVLEDLEEAVTRLGYRGIKLHIGECTLAQYVTDPVVELAGRHGVPCLVDCAGRHEAMERMAESFPTTGLIIAHMGRYLCRDEGLIDRFIGLAEQHRNVFLDVSGVVAVHKVVEAVDRVGSDRVVFGTDGPHEAPDTIGYARTELDKIRGLGLAPNDEEAVLGGTIARLLGI
jgi:predicted TIM-barrel fold metal-dependent hydrolase